VDSSVSKETDCGLGGWGSVPGRGWHSVATSVSSPTLGSTRPSVHCVPVAFLHGVKLTCPCSTEV
jgi:hypothetical protein